MKRKIFVGGISAICLSLGCIIIANFNNNPISIDAIQNLYTLTLDSSNPCSGTYSEEERTLVDKTDQLHNEISFNYLNVMEKSNYFGQFKKSTGCIYNSKPLNYIKSITVDFESQATNPNMYIAIGPNQHPEKTGNYIITPTNQTVTFTSNYQPYFALYANNGASFVKSIKIKYFCVQGDFNEGEELPSSSEEASSSSSSSQIPVKPIPGANNISLTDLPVHTIPTSYTSSGLTFSHNNLNLFANYIVDDYKGGVSQNSIVLKEKGYGLLMNTNPITNLKTLSFDYAYNPTSLKVFGSNTFNTKWEEIQFSTTTDISIGGKYSYFKLTTFGNDNFGFDTLRIVYDSLANENNDIYVKKTINEVNNKEIESLITTSASSFINDQKWINKGYAKDIQEAKNNTLNKNISGFNGYSDYQIDFNPNVIYNNDLIGYRVADMSYGDNGNSFQINMLDGSKGPVIYKDAAYTFVEDIAAYITAFGDVPPNMKYDKNSKTLACNEWGKYGRVNYNFYHNTPSGKFQFETECQPHRYYFNPNENNNDFYYHYFESDYGASVGNNEPAQKMSEYPTNAYNNNGKITNRGTLRFVWTKAFTNQLHGSNITTNITNSYDRNVYFTNNHYNDFQQYLNYYGGWTLRFGNTTLGNEWDCYDSNNHLSNAPRLPLASLSELRK